jgi:hypothetical protein
MPFRASAARRRRVRKRRHRVTNRAEYDAGPRARGGLTLWLTAEAVAAWRAGPRTGRGGQPPCPRSDARSTSAPRDPG